MTEGRLFAIGFAIWLYKWILEWAAQRKKALSRPNTALLHGLFYATVGVLLAVTIYAYMGNVRGFFNVGVMGGAFGLIAGLTTGYYRASSAEAKKELIAVDLEWAQTASSAVLLASVIMYTTIQAFKIPSGSMHPTLYEGDHLFVNKFYYGIKIPFTETRVARVSDVDRGDVVVFRFPSEDTTSQHYGKDFIKRAVALPGDKVEIRDKEIWINGEKIETENYTQFVDSRTFPKFNPKAAGITPEDYESLWQKGELGSMLRGDEIRDNFGPVTIPEGHYFCLGDNRDASYDSRFWGPLPLSYLKGKAWFIYWPPRRIKIIR